MQDVHWGCGLFGYFPCYTLGAMYAAQWFATMRRERPALDAEITRGELTPVFDWLKSRIWSQGSRWETPELVQSRRGLECCCLRGQALPAVLRRRRTKPIAPRPASISARLCGSGTAVTLTLSSEVP